jgi:hypothetical protein
VKLLHMLGRMRVCSMSGFFMTHGAPCDQILQEAVWQQARIMLVFAQIQSNLVNVIDIKWPPNVLRFLTSMQVTTDRSSLSPFAWLDTLRQGPMSLFFFSGTGIRRALPPLDA